MSTNLRQQKIKNTLEVLCLSAKEIKVLLMLLQKGKANAPVLASLLPNISRTSIYDQLKSLEKKGLVNSIIEDKTIFYQPQDLEHVIDNLEYDKKAIEQKQNNLRSVTDLYKQIKSGTAYRPGVRKFIGPQGVRAVHREVQDARKKLRAIGNLSAVIRAFPSVRTEDNLKDFQTYKILRKSLMVHNSKAEQYLKIAPPSDFHQVKWLPKDTTINTDTLIWDGHVAIIDYTEPINAVVIDNPTIYDTFVGWFEMIWKISEVGNWKSVVGSR